MDKKNFYLTTTIPYVNAEPHIGFALESVQADAVARYKRLTGSEVFFNAGTDEHGQKIWEKATEEGVDIQVYVDKYVNYVKELKELLNLSYDNFVRTTDESHKKAAQKLWELCDKNGDIEKKKFKGLYCVGCEKFLTERDMEDGKCPLHPGQEPVELEEENYFFKLSNYQDFLLEYLNQKNVILPEHRRQEALNFVNGGLEDFSISREKEKLPWGVAVPGDDTQVMYVWFDALTNYISTLGWPNETGQFEKFWEEGEVVQMAGKDQIRFQSIMWPAMLKSAGIKAPDQIFYHGFINSGGQKMSKSIGNVISPKDMVKKYGMDATRYILLRHIHPTDDTDVTWEKMDEWYTANLVNGLGNFVSRVMKMSEQYIDFNTIEPGIGFEFVFKKSQDVFLNRIKNFRFDDGMDYIWEQIALGDKQIQEKKPFQLIKSNPEEAQQNIANLVQRIWTVSSMLEPFMPETSEIIQKTIKENKKPENLFKRLPTEWKNVPKSPSLEWKNVPKS